RVGPKESPAAIVPAVWNRLPTGHPGRRALFLGVPQNTLVMNLRCIIVDDEPNAVNLLEVLIGQTTGWQLLAKCLNALDAISFLKNNQVDFVFLDIEMPLLSGMELAGLLSPD